MVGEGGYIALERGDIISAFNEFYIAEKNVDEPLEKSKLMINMGALLIAIGKYNLAAEELIQAKALLKSAGASNDLLAVVCLNIAKAMIAMGSIEGAKTELKCAESIIKPDDPRLVYVKALIYFYMNDQEKLNDINEEIMPEPYRRLIKLIKLRVRAEGRNSDERENYDSILRKTVPLAELRDALGLV